MKNVFRESVTAAIFSLLPISAQAATLTWSGGNGNWDTDARWGGAEPVSGDLARVLNGDTVTVDLAGEIAGGLQLSGSSTVTVGADGNLTLNAISLTYSLSIAGNSSLNVQGGTVAVSGVVNNYLNGGGAIYVSNGSLTHSASNLRFGDSATTGTLDVSGSGSWSSGNLNMIGTGIVNLTGSSAQISGVNLNNSLGGNMTVNFTPDGGGINFIGANSINLTNTDTLNFNTDALVGAQAVKLFGYTGTLTSTFNTVNVTNSNGNLTPVGDIGSVVQGTYFLEYDTVGKDITLHYNAVPETGFPALLGLAGLSLLLRRRR